mmetsp:Transcript_3763/g.8869  ORF Transcript_3763/g.8869 Transcript_3763/m.8869 type:complete len:205 (-) Transcript_3763:2200-2814(-)
MQMGEQRQKQWSVAAEAEERLGARLLEALLPLAVLHRIVELLVDPYICTHGRAPRLLAQDITKVNMEKVALVRDHHVVLVTVADSKQVGDDAVAGHRGHEALLRLFDVVVELDQVVQDALVLLLHIEQCLSVGHHLYQALVWRSWNNVIRHQVQIQPDLALEHEAHQPDDGEDHCVWPHVFPLEQHTHRPAAGHLARHNNRRCC